MWLVAVLVWNVTTGPIFFFDERDRELICKRRRECNRLGFAVQLGTVRYLGRFLEDPSSVSEQVVRWVARELGVDPSGLGAYARGEARWDHQAEIRREYGYGEFHEPNVELELVRWSCFAGAASKVAVVRARRESVTFSVRC